MKLGILGGGLSGITLQKYVQCESEILEKEERPGGLCRSFEKEGFTYDIGGHILFSKNNQIMITLKGILKENINCCKRNNKILFKDRFAKYPFENGLNSLDKEDIYDCLVGFIKNENPKPKNFLQWIYYNLGNGIADKYLVPYNKKIWKYPLDKMSMEWVERVPKPPVEDIIKSAIGLQSEGYVHQLHFLYPLFGGIESLIKASTKPEGNITTKFHITKIQKNRDGWAISDDHMTKYFDNIVITFPVTQAIKHMENVPREVIKAASGLIHNRIRIILVGINNTSLMDKSALYIPQDDVVFHRLCFMGYFSPNNVPLGCSSLIAEITTNSQNEWHNVSDATLIEKTINDLSVLKIVDKNDIKVTDIQNIEYGYIVYDSNYKNNISIVRKYFNSIGVKLLGRFGEFEYINMDEVLMRSKGLAEKMNKKILN
ncbi:MAG: NAD(P)-binding protein [Bacteroidota bacterium]